MDMLRWCQVVSSFEHNVSDAAGVAPFVAPQVGTPKTHRRYLGRDEGTYGPIPSRRWAAPTCMRQSPCFLTLRIMRRMAVLLCALCCPRCISLLCTAVPSVDAGRWASWACPSTAPQYRACTAWATPHSPGRA